MKTEKIAQAIKAALVKLAVEDKLPADMSTLDENILIKAIESTVEPDDKIRELVGNYTSNDPEEYDAIIKSLREYKAAGGDMEETVDGFNFDSPTEEGEYGEISIWGALEDELWTIEKFCDEVGL